MSRVEEVEGKRIIDGEERDILVSRVVRCIFKVKLTVCNMKEELGIRASANAHALSSSSSLTLSHQALRVTSSTRSDW